MQADCPLFSFFNGLVPGFSHAKDHALANRVDATPNECTDYIIHGYLCISPNVALAVCITLPSTRYNKVQTTIVRLLFYTKIKLVGPNPKFLPTTAKNKKTDRQAGREGDLD